MHTIKPNTNYRIVTIHVAVPESLGDEFTDGMNDMLNGCLMNTEQTGEEFIADWQYKDEEIVATSSSDPVEGELFNRINAEYAALCEVATSIVNPKS